MQKLIMLKYGELSTKKGNINLFLNTLKNNIKFKLNDHSEIKFDKGRMFIYPKSSFDEILDKLKEVFGIHEIEIAYELETNDLETIKSALKEQLSNYDFKTFKVQTKRSDKSFYLDSMAISRNIGGFILKNFSDIKVDVHNPEITVNVEIRKNASYFYFEKIAGIGGYPVGVLGKGMLMLSGGIDSPVAGYMTIKRGVKLEAVYFESPPHTSIEAKNKVISLAKKLAVYNNDIKLHVINFTNIQEAIYKNIPHEYLITIMRRMMYRISAKIAYSDGTPLKNSDGSYQGMMTMKTALYKSRNIPAIQAFQQLDKEKVSDFVHRLGINYGDNLYESAAIGGFNGMSPLSMSAAYAAFARGGYYIEPYSFTKIVYRQDDNTYETKINKVKAMSEETAYMMNNMLTYAGANGVAGKVNVSGTDVAAKTGTSTVDKEALKKYKLPDSTSMDNWVAVYSPDYSISLWYGYKELSSQYYTTAIEGANARVRISAALANRIFKKNSKFTKPDSVVESTVEIGTNPAQKPSSYTPSSLISTEYFNKENAPKETSPRFSQLNDPTNGNASVSGNSIKLTWTGISTPSAIDSSYLEEYYKKAYGKNYERYLKHMTSYTKNILGNVGYQVYLKSSTGALQDLGFTEDTSFTYNMSGQTSYSFIVKSTYSNFKSNMSNGITINVNGTPSSSTDNSSSSDTSDDIEISVEGSDCLALSSGTWTANNDIVMVNGKTISSSDISYSYFKSDGNSAGTSIPLDTEGFYTIKYKVKYKGSIYDANRQVQVGGSC
jgi:tRNA uracil 4-sulfurtransferase